MVAYASRSRIFAQARELALLLKKLHLGAKSWMIATNDAASSRFRYRNAGENS